MSARKIPGAEVYASRARLTVVLQQHVEDSVVIHGTRTLLSCAPHVKLNQLGRFDERLAAHLDGLAVAGEAVRTLVDALSESPNASTSFVSTVLAIESKNRQALDRVLALAEVVPEICPGLLGAFGWVEPPQLQGIVAEVLDSPHPLRRLTGIAASAMHRVDPGLVPRRWLENSDAHVRARAFRTVGELGRHELVSQLAAASGDGDPSCAFWAAWSGVLLGDRQRALGHLRVIALEEGPLRQRALELALLASPPAAGQELLRNFSSDSMHGRLLFRGIGLMGDPALIPWLIDQMGDEAIARKAGESFSLITGADLAWLDLERKPPEGITAGPNDDPEDPNVDMDEDEGLPWPDLERVRTWWVQNSGRFQSGVRHFMGEPLNRENCMRVLKEGFQRQRIAAALHLSLLNPGTPLFEWRAPAWRQQRQLAQMG